MRSNKLKRSALILVVGCSLLVLLGAWYQNRAPAHGNPDALVNKARRLKAAGETAQIIMTISHPPHVPDFDHLLSKAALVITATYLDKRYRLSGDGEGVETLAKFRVEDVISGRHGFPGVAGNGPEDRRGVPAGLSTLLPILEDEIIVHDVGGILKIEGVLFRHGGSNLFFEKGKQYLLFLDRFKPQFGKHYGTARVPLYYVIAGRHGCFEVDVDDEGQVRTLGGQRSFLGDQLKKDFLSKKRNLIHYLRLHKRSEP